MDIVTVIGVASAGRNQIKDWSIDVAQLKYVSPRLFLIPLHSLE
jgi:iron complex outermembrane receptor protein